jgi:hypothetical protein
MIRISSNEDIPEEPQDELPNQDNPNDEKAFTSEFTVIRREGEKLVAIPYSNFWIDKLTEASKLLKEAAEYADNPTLKKYLNSRADAFLSNDYYQSDMDWMDLEDQKIEIVKQLEQENRRLVYVAITRSKYKCYINSNVKTKSTTLKYFEEAIKKATPKGIEFVDENPEIDPDYRYNAAITPFPIDYKKAQYFNLEQKNWHKISYTFLNVEHAHLPKNSDGKSTDPYDEFIFKKLKKGAYTGNLLHYIFEFINFSDDSQWKKIIATALKRLSPGYVIHFGEGNTMEVPDAEADIYHLFESKEKGAGKKLQAFLLDAEKKYNISLLSPLRSSFNF